MSRPCWACVFAYVFVQAASQTQVPLDNTCSLVFSSVVLDGTLLISDRRKLVIHL